MNPAKPWLSMNKQLEQLKKRGLHVDDDHAAADYLQRIGYYRLSGYWYPLRRSATPTIEKKRRSRRADSFLDKSRFEDVVNLYIFDKKLRLLALDALERIELSLRVEVAYLLGEKCPYAHEEPSYLHGNFAKRRKPSYRKTLHQDWLERYQRRLKQARKEAFVDHHNRYYNGRLPIWVAIEVWDFGLLSHLYAGMKIKDQNLIASKYNLENGKILEQWIRSLNFIRNVSAHHSRLWNVNVLDSSASREEWGDIPTTKPFMYFAVMSFLLGSICPNSTWTERLISHLETFPHLDNGAFNLKGFGANENWREILYAAAKNREPART